MHIYVQTNKAFSINFFGQQHKDETAEMSTEHDEAEPENDQLSERNLSC